MLLWPDTFNNYFFPDTASAAVEVLEAAGFQVILPARVLCCGRPLYDFGMLSTAKRLLRQVLIALEPEIQEGIPVVGLEPSCVSVFRDELLNLFPTDENAIRLAQQTYFFSEFLMRYAPNWNIPEAKRPAILHGHCHHKAILSFEDEIAVLKRAGFQLHVPDSGCCGMAGSFGFEEQKYDVSVACAERVLLSEIREASEDVLVISSGLSCREQIAALSARQAIHVAQALQLTLSPSSQP